MKVSDTEWQWDRNKLTIYFTAEKRVDFRALVRDLASHFRTRIELRQIGVRDEAARLSRRRPLRPRVLLQLLARRALPVNLGLAKDQHLSLNPTQISGGCGRLLCCLKYEHEFYVDGPPPLPEGGQGAHGSRGPERVVAVDIFRERVFLRSEEHGSRIIPLVQLREEVEARGEVLNTAESRSRLAVAAESPVAAAVEDGPTAVDELPLDAEARRARSPPRPRRRAAARPRREAHRTDAGGGGTGGTRATIRRRKAEARGP